MDNGFALQIFVIGALGALASDIINRRGYFRFRRVGQRKIDLYWDLGTPGNMFVGGVAAFAFWAFKLLNPEQQIAEGAAAVCGFAGARVLTYLADNKLLTDKKEGLESSLTERATSV